MSPDTFELPLDIARFDIPERTIAASVALKDEEQAGMEKSVPLLESHEDPDLQLMFVRSRIRDSIDCALSSDAGSNLQSTIDRARGYIAAAFSLSIDELRHDFEAFLREREEKSSVSLGERFSVAMAEEHRSERSCRIFSVLKPDIAHWKYQLTSAFLAKGQCPPEGDQVHGFVFRQYEIARAECEENGGSEESPEQAGLRIGRELDELFASDPGELVAIFEAGNGPPQDMQFA